MSFLARFFFVRTLGDECLGLNGLLTNVVAVLSLAELGVGEAIIYSLYKPLAVGDTKKVAAIMRLFKKIYTVISIAIAVLGVAIMPVIPHLANNYSGVYNIYYLYLLFLLNTVVSYLMSYKRNLIIADQKRYIATVYRYLFYSAMCVVQSIILILTKNYSLFLVLQVIFTVLENYMLSKKADKLYPFLKEKNSFSLKEKTRKEISSNTKAMLMHKIGGVVVNSTDNIVISSFVSLVAVGLYSNYLLIINGVHTILSQIFTSMMASVGNLCAIESIEEQKKIFKSIFLVNFWVYSLFSICFLFLVNPFIKIWLGESFLFSDGVVMILFLNMYVTGIRKSALTFREAKGLFVKDKWKAIIESMMNIILSIILAQVYGVFGVFLGTLLSSLFVCVWVEPYILYKYGFKEKVSKYFKTLISYSVLMGLICMLLSGLFMIRLNNLLVDAIIRLSICLIVPNVIYYLCFRRTKEFCYIATKLLKRKRKS